VGVTLTSFKKTEKWSTEKQGREKEQQVPEWEGKEKNMQKGARGQTLKKEKVVWGNLSKGKGFRSQGGEGRGKKKMSKGEVCKDTRGGKDLGVADKASRGRETNASKRPMQAGPPPLACTNG